jgi:hypothetical protein
MFVARDMQHLKDLALDSFTNRPGVTRIETSIIYEARVRHELPQLQEPTMTASLCHPVFDPIGADDFAAFDGVCIETARPAGLGGLDRLAMGLNDQSQGARFRRDTCNLSTPDSHSLPNPELSAKLGRSFVRHGACRPELTHIRKSTPRSCRPQLSGIIREQ